MANTYLKINAMTLQDFIKKDKNSFVSKDGRYSLHKDRLGFVYPCTIHTDYFACMVHISYDYSFTFEGALEILNMVLEGTWRYGEGRYLNGLQSEKNKKV